MQALIDLLRAYQPDLADAIAPAEASDIRGLTRLAGPLPGALVRFLRTMGGTPARLLVPSMYLGVDAMRGALLAAAWLQDPRYLIFTSHEEYDAYLWLDRSSPSPPDDVMVVISPPVESPTAPRRWSPFAVGLEDLLYVETFREHRLGLFDHRAHLACTIPGDAKAIQHGFDVPAQFGLRRLAPHLASGLFERGDAALVVRRGPQDRSLHVHLGADDPEQLATIVASYLSQPSWKNPHAPPPV
jgi:hypothetical protein